MNPVLFRKATTNDIQPIFSLFRENYIHGYYHPYFTSTEKLECLFQRNDFTGMVAVWDRKVIGFSGIYTTRYGHFSTLI